MTVRHEVQTPDGRTLVVHDTGEPAGGTRLTLVWHHGSPQTGALLAPVVEPARERFIRVVSYGRPSYGGSTPLPGRRVTDAAADVAAVMDSLGVGRFAVMGASGGGPHALACAALLGDRVAGAVVIASPAPHTDEIDWFGGMQAPGGLRSALDGGREGRARFAETDTFDEAQFVAADWVALRAEWGALGADSGAADADGPDGLIDDDVAFASPWGFELEAIEAPVLVVQGTEDRVIPRAHGEWLAHGIAGAELWLRDGDGHVSALRAVPDAMDWLVERA